MERSRRSADPLLALAVAQGLSHEEAARRCHVSSATLSRRKRQPAFLALVEQARQDLWREAIGKASANVTQAVETLVAICESGQSEAVRVQAAGRLLDLVNGHLTGAGLEQRIAALEAQDGSDAHRHAVS
jgi:hypothetical protein